MDQKYPILDCLNQVADFHKTFMHPILDNPQIPSAKRCELRISLLQEELNELKVAIYGNDIVEAADAFCDLQYVLSGAILEFGLGDKFKELFDEVQRSNMSKAHDTYSEAKETAEKSCSEGIDCFIEQNKETEKWVVVRKKDGKTIKNVKYSEADLKTIINN